MPQQSSLSTMNRRNLMRHNQRSPLPKKELEEMKVRAKIDEEAYEKAGIKLEGIKTPKVNDVICGRGGGSNHHPGNKRFRDLVQMNKVEYQKLPSKERRQKQIIAYDVVHQIRYGQFPYGRFLEQDIETNLWHDVLDELAKKKTSQALREDGNSKSKREKREQGKKKRVARNRKVAGPNRRRTENELTVKVSDIDEIWPKQGSANAESSVVQHPEEVEENTMACEEVRVHSLMDDTEDMLRPVFVPIDPSIFGREFYSQLFHDWCARGAAEKNTNEDDDFQVDGDAAALTVSDCEYVLRNGATDADSNENKKICEESQKEGNGHAKPDEVALTFDFQEHIMDDYNAYSTPNVDSIVMDTENAIEVSLLDDALSRFANVSFATTRGSNFENFYEEEKSQWDEEPPQFDNVSFTTNDQTDQLASQPLDMDMDELKDVLWILSKPTCDEAMTVSEDVPSTTVEPPTKPQLGMDDLDIADYAPTLHDYDCANVSWGSSDILENYSSEEDLAVTEFLDEPPNSFHVRQISFDFSTISAQGHVMGHDF